MKWRIALLAASFALAQTRKLEFEVASLKPAPPVTLVTFTSVGFSGGPNSNTPDRYSYRGARTRDLIAKAYGLTYVDEQIVGPDWLVKRWDLAATMPATTTQTEFEEMLRKLLLDRFHLKLHIESRQLPVLEMVVAKNGLKLKPATEPLAPAAPLDSKVDDDGFPVARPGFGGFAMRSGGPRGLQSQNWVFGHRTTAELANFLSTVAGRRILDKTGADGVYDAKLQYDREPQGPTAAIPDRPVITLADAMEQQLGLRLVDSKAAFDVVVVESGNATPDEN